jgi:hypothetical protein
MQNSPLGSGRKKNKKRLTFIVVAAVITMFAVRFILMQTGELAKITTLDANGQKTWMQAREVTIVSPRDGKVLGSGSILDSYKNSTKDKTYTCSIVTTDAVALQFENDSAQDGDSADSSQSSAGGSSEKSSKDAKTSEASEKAQGAVIVMPDGTKADFSFGGVNEGAGIGVLNAQSKEETSEAKFTKKGWVNLQEGQNVYCLSDGTVVTGTYKGNDLVSFDADWPDTMLGCGIYDNAGNFLGTLVNRQNGEGLLLTGADVTAFVQDVEN